MTPAAGSPPRMRGKPRPRSSCQRSSRITPAHAGKTTPGRSSAHPTPDHPRACGENRVWAKEIFVECGSPPRMRGKPLRTPHLCKSVRITPAHAGKTALYCASSMSASDHPRACGENWKRALTLSATSGSPPRMRGKRKEVSHGRKGIRITPAHAGKTRTFASSPLSQPDHPRACGENRSRGGAFQFILGSPPRMRGKRCH